MAPLLLAAIAAACGGDGETSTTTTSATGEVATGAGGAGGAGTGGGDAYVSASVGSSTSDASAPSSGSGTGGGPCGDASGSGGGCGEGGQGAGGAGGGGGELPDFASLPWETGDDVGFGVARKDSQDARARGVFIGYAGYGMSLQGAQAWATELYEATLRERGVRWVVAVQGPADPGYADLEIGNSRIAAFLTGEAAAAEFVLAVAHSSGAFVAHELFRQLAGGHDPAGITDDAVVYFDLDGGWGGLDDATVGRLRRAYFVSAFDGDTGTASSNASSIEAAAARWPEAGGHVELDVSGSGCSAGAVWCVHMTPITTRPHDPDGMSGDLDYSDYEGRAVEHRYLEAAVFDGALP